MLTLKVLLDEKKVLHNRTMHISGIFETEVYIESAEVDIESTKVDIQNKLLLDSNVIITSSRTWKRKISVSIKYHRWEIYTV